jgi:hypothetical protein
VTPLTPAPLPIRERGTSMELNDFSLMWVKHDSLEKIYKPKYSGNHKGGTT